MNLGHDSLDLAQMGFFPKAVKQGRVELILLYVISSVPQVTCFAPDLEQKLFALIKKRSQPPETL